MKSLQKKSTCRVTKRPIALFRQEADDPGYVSWRSYDLWLYTDVPLHEAIDLQRAGERPLPADFCWRDTSVGDTCQTKIRPENIRAQLWACGRHMRVFQEEQDRVRRNREQELKNKERDLLREWEFEKSKLAYERLVELGWAAVLIDEPPSINNWGGTRNVQIRSLSLTEFLEIVDDQNDPEKDEEYEDEFETVPDNFFT